MLHVGIAFSRLDRIPWGMHSVCQRKRCLFEQCIFCLTDDAFLGLVLSFDLWHLGTHERNVYLHRSSSISFDLWWACLPFVPSSRLKTAWQHAVFEAWRTFARPCVSYRIWRRTSPWEPLTLSSIQSSLLGGCKSLPAVSTVWLLFRVARIFFEMWGRLLFSILQPFTDLICFL